MTPNDSFSQKVQKSREAGYSDDEIANFLSQKDSGFGEKYLKSKSEGFSSTDVFSFLGAPKQQISQETTYLPAEVAHKGARLGMMAGKGLALAQPAVFIPEIAGQALHSYQQSPQVQSQNFRQAAISEIEHMQDQKAFGNWTDKDEERLQEFYNMASMTEEQISESGGIHEAPNFAPSAIFKEAGKKIGIDTEAEGILEKSVEFGSMLASGRPETAVLNAQKFATSKLNKVVTPEVVQLAKNSMKTAALVVPAAVAEESIGIPMELSLLGMGIGQATMQIGKAAISSAGKKFFLFDPTNLKATDWKNSVKAELGREQEYLQQQVIQGIMKAKDLEKMQPFIDKAVELGIPITPNTLVNSKYFRNMERIVSQNEMTAERATEFRQEVAKSWTDLTEKSLKKMETNLEFSTPGSTAEALMSDVTRQQHKKLVNEYTEGYSQSAKGLKNSENLEISSYREIEDSVNHVLDEIGDTLAPTTAQTSAKALAHEIKESMSVPIGNGGRKELTQIKLETGEVQKAEEISTAGKKVQEKVQERIIKKAEAEEAKKEYIGKRRKKGKREAKRKLQEKSEEALASKTSVEYELEQARIKTLKAEEKQRETFFKSQQDLEDVLGPNAKYFQLDKNGHLRIIKPMNGQTLVNTIKSLNSIIDWENPGIVNLYAHTRRTAKDILKRQYGMSHPDAIKNLEEANAKFGKTQQLFGKQSKWKKWGIDSESTSEELLRTINSVDKLKQFEHDFGHTTQGKLYIDHLKYQKAKEILEPIFSKREYKAGDVASSIDMLKRNPYFQHIVPKETWNNLTEIANLDAKIEQRSANFFKEHVPQNQRDTFYLNVKHFIKKWGWKQVEDLSVNRRADAYANFFLDPSYTKQSKDLLSKILHEMQKPNPDLGLIQKYDGLLGNIGNNLSQIAKVSSIEAISEE